MGQNKELLRQIAKSEVQSQFYLFLTVQTLDKSLLLEPQFLVSKTEMIPIMQVCCEKSMRVKLGAWCILIAQYMLASFNFIGKL